MIIIRCLDRRGRSFVTLLLISILFTLFFPYESSAQSEEEMRVLQMYFREEELVITPTRSLKPTSRVATNISVVTAEDIRKMNAHTLTDVLNTVPGVQVTIRGGVGSEATALIQGSEYRHVLVMIDGVSLNNLSDNVTDISSIPVQHIERIEIIKGPASSSWGSSLGGVINIITKSPDQLNETGGTFSASMGEQGTGDNRFEFSGTSGSLGYYFYGGNISSNGLRPSTKFDENNVYTKFRWDITGGTDMTLTFGYNKGSRGRGEYAAYNFRSENDFEYYNSTLSLNHSINDAATVNVSLRTSRHDAKYYTYYLSTGDEFEKNAFDDKDSGASAGVTWSGGAHSVVAGIDYDNGELESESVTNGRQRLEKLALFANDTITVEDLSVTPGIRYDHTNTNGDFVSPSMGVAYQLAEKTVLRGYAARGFNIPPLSYTFATGFFSVPNPDLDVEEVWSFQAGMETTAFKYVQVRSNVFRHNIYNSIVNEEQPDGTVKNVNKDKQRRQGFEIEIKTMPVYNTSLLAGFIFIDSKNRDTGEELINTPKYTYDIGIQYEDDNFLNALLTGHYIWWNYETFFNGSYSAFIWDLNLAKSVFNSGKGGADLFFTMHNIFNASQYSLDQAKNPGRWVEGGVRLNF